jgi:hypothetical protein
MPKIFILSSHGSMPIQDTKTATTAFSLPLMGMTKLKKVTSFQAPVDTFTTARFGCSFFSDLRCDEPFVDFVREFNSRRVAMKTRPTKPQLRKLIKDTLLHARDLQHADVVMHAENKIRCHKKESPITDLFLFGTNPAVPVTESVTMFDLETGEIQDVHTQFGLKKKKKVDATRTMPPHHPDALSMLQAAKMSAESELEELKAQRADPYFVDMKIGRIQSIDDTIACMHKGSKFEYSAKMKKLYKDRIKLSDLLRQGIAEGVIDPDDDSVVVYACRVPDEGFLGAQTSPRNSSDSERSVGGGTRSKPTKQRCRTKTCKQRRH